MIYLYQNNSFFLVVKSDILLYKFKKNKIINKKLFLIKYLLKSKIKNNPNYYK